MSDPNNQDPYYIIFDLAYNSIVTNSISPKTFYPALYCFAKTSWIFLNRNLFS